MSSVYGILEATSVLEVLQYLVRVGRPAGAVSLVNHARSGMLLAVGDRYS